MSTLMAASSVGKSYIGVRTAAIAQKSGKMVVIFDSEYAIDKTFCSALGLDLSKCKYFPVRSIEQCKNAIYQFLTFVIENGLQKKFFILVDSLGAMISELQFRHGYQVKGTWGDDNHDGQYVRAIQDNSSLYQPHLREPKQHVPDH